VKHVYAPRNRAVWVYAISEAIDQDQRYNGTLRALETALGTGQINHSACDLIEMLGTPPDHLRRLLADYYGVSDRALQPHVTILQAHEGRVAILTEEATLEELPTQPKYAERVRFLVKLPVHKHHQRKDT